MLTLITILESLKVQPRRLTDEESLYLDQLSDELHRAQSDAARWRIFEREGFTRIEGFEFTDDVIDTLTTVRRAAMN